MVQMVGVPSAVTDAHAHRTTLRIIYRVENFRIPMGSLPHVELGGKAGVQFGYRSKSCPTTSLALQAKPSEFASGSSCPSGNSLPYPEQKIND